MRVGLDPSALENNKLTGLGIYAREFIQALSRNHTDDHQLYLLLRSLRRRSFTLPLPKDVCPDIHRVLHPNIGHRWLDSWLRRVSLPLYCKKLDLDIYHSLRDFRIPYVATTRTLLTVHDLFRFRKGEWYAFTGPELSYHSNLVRQGLTGVDTIVAVSRATKHDIVDLFSISEEKIEVVYPGIPSNRKLMDEGLAREMLRRHLNLEPPFILAVGTGRRKNPVRLIQALGLLKQTEPVDHQLVFAGSPKDYISNMAHEMNIRGSVRCLGYVQEYLMNCLYNCAALVAYPSLYEGFGIPIVEAMACGTPVITGSTSSMPEVAGGAALLVDQYDPESISEGIRRIIRDDTLRQRLVKSGRERAEHFRWNRAMERVFALYRRLTS